MKKQTLILAMLLAAGLFKAESGFALNFQHCPAPELLTVSQTGVNDYVLTWANTNYWNGINIEYSINGGISWNGNGGSPISPRTLTNLPNHQVIHFRLTGYCNSGSATSNTIIFHKPIPITYAYDATGNRISRTIVLPPAPKSYSIATPDYDPELAFNEINQKQESENQPEYLDSLDGIDLNIFPNPTRGLVTVEIKQPLEKQRFEYFVAALNGTVIARGQEQNQRMEIDLSGHPAGTYFLTIVSGEAKTSWKIIKL